MGTLRHFVELSTGRVTPDRVELEYGPLSQQARSGLCARNTCAFVRAALAALLLLLVGISSVSAQVPRAYAGIVVDAKTGNTLYSYAADSTRYPASVTKVMTLYIVFQELKAGRLSLNTRMRVSRYATQAVPSKLNLRAGTTIKVEDAIKALVTKSANDVARVIAEHISGSESAFAQRMTRTARALGMNRTTYANASGLPDRRQVTTVRDQARLGMAIFQHFPEYYDYFQTRRFTYGGRTYGNHNRLLGQNGVDGIKTGYTRASGFNLLTAARANNRHIVVVGFGFSSSAARNAKVRDLINRYMGRARRGSYWRQAAIPPVGALGSGNVFAVAQNTPVSPAPLPAFRLNAGAATPADPTIRVAAHDANSRPVQLVEPAPLPAARARELAALDAQPVALAAIEPPTQLIPQTAVQATILEPAPAPARPVDVIGAWLNENFTLGSRRTGQLQNAPPTPLLPPAPIGQAATGQSGEQAIDLMTSGSISQDGVQNGAQPAAVAATQNDAPLPVWVVQIGAPPSAEAAQGLLDSATRSISALSDFRPYVERFEKTGQTFFRARFAGFAEREQAVSMCEQIKRNNLSCLAVQS